MIEAITRYRARCDACDQAFGVFARFVTEEAALQSALAAGWIALGYEMRCQDCSRAMKVLNAMPEVEDYDYFNRGGADLLAGPLTWFAKVAGQRIEANTPKALLAAVQERLVMARNLLQAIGRNGNG